jgi:hypothetical protein
VIQVFAHGDPSGGKLKLGGWVVDNDELDGFKGQGWERSFVPDADVQFNTCHLAASAGGEYFLAQFASTFLQRGGCAHASPNYVASDFACQGGAYALGSPCANWVHAEVSAGGLVTLKNATYLKVELIIARLEQLRLRYSIPLRAAGIRKVDLSEVTTTAQDVIPEEH